MKIFWLMVRKFSKNRKKSYKPWNICRRQRQGSHRGCEGVWSLDVRAESLTLINNYIWIYIIISALFWMLPRMPGCHTGEQYLKIIRYIHSVEILKTSERDMYIVVHIVSTSKLDGDFGKWMTEWGLPSSA